MLPLPLVAQSGAAGAVNFDPEVNTIVVEGGSTRMVEVEKARREV
jgi:hypothetical protein